MRRIASVTTAGALTCAAVMVAGCGAGVTGARREGPAPPATPKVRSTAAPAIASHPQALVEMIRKDTGVSPDVREDLTPCDGHDYPMDTDSGDLTAGDGPDLVVNITTCGDGLGIASYVYRMIDGKYQNVFADEHSPVYGSVEDGRLEIVHEVYRTDDPVSYPTGEEAVTYAWRGNHFVQVGREFQDFSSASPSVSPEPLSTDPVPLPDSDPLDPGLPSGSPHTATHAGTHTTTHTATHAASHAASPTPSGGGR
ncbi:hypothetical protein VSR01_22975 [Actinacidiphila sp. DG2A-62]|uniref:hypothetical protein n=1 Tax=Actinacidiphila sp. DG2A-62 TaxID=3108821 RepID=UPI002DBE42AD|nr:hypothetical protein [Actinacidiphila sp. DG2A-62]MEC3996226.1 hypothetical protein [Actinacidiphila sp. DG2A-62]